MADRDLESFSHGKQTQCGQERGRDGEGGDHPGVCLEKWEGGPARVRRRVVLRKLSRAQS